METKASVFMSVMIIFMPLLLFAENTSIYLIISFIILMVISIENIILCFKHSKDSDLNDELDKLRSDIESSASLNLKKLELGFKTAKSIFTATFVVSALLILNKNIFIIAFSVLVLFLSVVELKNYDSSHKKIISAASGIVNIIYLAIVAATKFVG